VFRNIFVTWYVTHPKDFQVPFWKACRILFIKRGLSTMADAATTHRALDAAPAQLTPRVLQSPPGITEGSNQADTLAPATDITRPPATARTILDVAVDYESAVADLEALADGADAYFQDWLKNNDAWLRGRANRDRKTLMDDASKKVLHLESEMAGAVTTLGLRSTAVRSKIAV
jgi:hypothetical protein